MHLDALPTTIQTGENENRNSMHSNLKLVIVIVALFTADT